MSTIAHILVGLHILIVGESPCASLPDLYVGKFFHETSACDINRVFSELVEIPLI